MAVASMRIEPDEGDAALAARLRKALRQAGQAPLLIEGDFSPGIDDGEAAAAWLGLLTASAGPLAVHCDGPLGQRGVGVLLAVDIAFAGPRAQLMADWRETPGLAALAARRGGVGLARRLLFGDAIVSLADLASLGLVVLSQTNEEIRACLDSFDVPGARRRKRALRAAEGLPFAEALAFDLAFVKTKKEVAA